MYLGPLDPLGRAGETSQHVPTLSSSFFEVTIARRGLVVLLWSKRPCRTHPKAVLMTIRLSGGLNALFFTML